MRTRSSTRTAMIERHRNGGCSGSEATRAAGGAGDPFPRRLPRPRPHAMRLAGLVAGPPWPN